MSFQKIFACLLAALILSMTMAGCQTSKPASGQDSQSSSQSQDSSSQQSSSSDATSDASSPSRTEGNSSQADLSSSPESSSQPENSQQAPVLEGTPSQDASSQQPEQPSQNAVAGTYSPRENLGMVKLSLSLQEDSTYSLNLSALGLSGSVTGSYTQEGNQLHLAAQDVSLPGYSAENVGNLDLTIQEDGSLFYLCGDFVSKVGINQESITFEK